MLRKIVEAITNEAKMKWKFNKSDMGMSGFPTISVESVIDGFEVMITVGYNTYDKEWFASIYGEPNDDLSAYEGSGGWQNLQGGKNALDMEGENLKLILHGFKSEFGIVVDRKPLEQLISYVVGV